MPFSKGLVPHNKIADTCSVDGCEQKHHMFGFCYSHGYRVKRYGNPFEPDHKPTGRPLTGLVPTHAAIHKRLARTRGTASTHICVDCGNAAAEWSYNGLDPDELIGRSGRFPQRYSLDLDCYEPRCRPCHRIFDGAGDRPRSPRGTFADISEVKP